ncbi:hypothetical protein FBUS_00151 [Fasciolopsis buskii]|uniref:Uncharacterized protein n=1 Tax=Fasciolopsis buskii TaxID=27845 RepID=A0A8E0RT06_9TREM|nr:hypothetical protein FBUS_00151 [Fasciolopsis buski]
MSTIIKEGPLQRWNGESHSLRPLFVIADSKSRWEQAYARLNQSGWLDWYEKASSKRRIHGVDLKVVAAYFAFGDMLQMLPRQPSGVNTENRKHVMAVPHEPNRATTMTFLMCNNEAEMKYELLTGDSDVYWFDNNKFSESPPENHTGTDPENTYTRNGSTEHIVPTSVAPSMAPPPTGSLPISPTPYPVQFGQIPLGQTYPPSQYPAYPPPPITSGVQPAPTAQVAYPQPVPPAYTAPVYTSPTIIQPVAYPVPSYPPQPVYMSPANQTSGMYNPAPISSGPQVHAIPQTVTSSNSGLRTAAIGLASGLAGNFLANRLFGGGWGLGWGGGWGGRWGGGYGGGWGGGWDECHDHGPVVIEETNIYNTEINDYDHGNDFGYADDFDGGSFGGEYED